MTVISKSIAVLLFRPPRWSLRENSMKPKGFFGTWMTLFALTGLPFGVLMSTVGGLETDEGLAAGFLFGVVFGVVMAPVMMSVKVRLTLDDRQAFVSRLNISMAELALKQANAGYVFC
jgi:hypothetical protein